MAQSNISGPTGTRTSYTLDLDNTMAFPDYGHIPVHPPAPDERWVIVAEVISDPTPRPGTTGVGFTVKDKYGDPFLVTFFTPTAARDVLPYKVGRMICLENACMSDFYQKLGCFVRDKSRAYMLPCSLAELRHLSAGLRSRALALLSLQDALLHDGGPHHNLSAIQLCLILTQDCQRRDWNNTHRKDCRALEALIIWNRTEWW
ncbi:hypothetical protein B0H15DRAFT_957841 [Mycena belliarum]|uniref:Uncharacterized protein n=1 Tax=Mycena belliarum TaxID=1033014 RepID=A0AAD6TM26_9AGAR|nr:hypothetical protein B0H15DRAFT_957841 [Mycena belliae]